jgi:hypothetical protein
MLNQPNIVSVGAQKYRYEDSVFSRAELVEMLLESLQSQEEMRSQIGGFKVEIKDLTSELKATEVKARKLQQLIYTIDEGLAEDLASYPETVQE